ncbi:MAG TPA: TIGR03435 family protein [Bryobacteraceae bacterium]|nr:TIGR03435 family protein [Bryobacteraceae bacterium]
MARLLSSPILLLLAGTALAQGQTFEAASVKPYDTASRARYVMQGGPGTSDPGRFLCRNCSLRSLLMTAYDIKAYQLASEVWSERYDVEATVPQGSSRSQFLVMLQNLLNERFRLALHHQIKEMSTYRLVAGNGGPKLTRSAPAASAPDEGHLSWKADKDGFPDLPPGAGITIFADAHNTYRLGAKNVSMQRFAAALSSSLSRPVYDATGLDGEYDFRLLWAPDPPGTVHRAQDGSVIPADPDADAAPSVQQAVQQQLGLRLEPATGQVDILVIDHAEKVPTAN